MVYVNQVSINSHMLRWFVLLIVLIKVGHIIYLYKTNYGVRMSVKRIITITQFHNIQYSRHKQQEKFAYYLCEGCICVCICVYLCVFVHLHVRLWRIVPELYDCIPAERDTSMYSTLSRFIISHPPIFHPLLIAYILQHY